MEEMDLRAFSETARRFAENELAPILATETRDGDIDGIPDVLNRAESIGLLAGKVPESPGYDYGVWGRAALAEGPSFSVRILEEIATVCGGAASCLHAGGLGVLESIEWADAPERPAVAFFEKGWHLSWDSLESPPHEASRLDGTKGPLSLTGEKPFVFAPPGCEGFVVFAASQNGWQRVLVPADTSGVRVTDVGARTGLVAAPVFHASFDQAQVVDAQVLPGSAVSFLRRYLLGFASIALGNARGALGAACRYAAERYQGGAMIRSHGAVRILVSDAASKIEACSAYLKCEAERETTGFGQDALMGASMAKLFVTTACCQAVTDCLQVFGGYGYMEDFRMEKRLRDAMTLKVMAPGPDELRMLCAARLMEGFEHDR
jgi:alkylation response protein AidB-like acyl-CoA dehydrogenase